MASRKEEKERLRREREERERAAQASERRKKLVGYVAGGILAAAALVGIVVVLASGSDGGGGPGEKQDEGRDIPASEEIPKQEVADLNAAVAAARCELLKPKHEGSTHVETPVTYRANPPTSGNHDPVPAEDGIYTSEPPRTEELVHALEHGRIEVQFRPGVPDKTVSDLRALVEEDPYHMILTPNPTKMPYEVAATAWDHSLVCKKMNPGVFDAIRAFKRARRDRGPEFVP